MIIYKITNKINGKSYIGQTVGSVRHRWRQHCHSTSHCSALRNAIKKYGADSFYISVLSECTDLTTLNDAEIYFIEHFQSLAPYGYNLVTGGDSKKCSDETRSRIAAARRGKPGPRLGKKTSVETRLKQSLAQKGRRLSDSHVRSLTAAQRLRRIKESNCGA